MTKESTGDKKTDTSSIQISLSDAVQIVNTAIRSVENQLIKMANRDEQDPVMLEGETTYGYPVHMMVDPKLVAKIMCEFNYATCYVLQGDAPAEMWDELARRVGLGEVSFVDMNLTT